MKKTLIILLAIAALLLTTCKKMPELKVCKLELTNENVAYSQTSAEIKVQYEYPTDLQYVNVTMSENSLFNPYLGVIAEVNDTAIIANPFFHGRCFHQGRKAHGLLLFIH